MIKGKREEDRLGAVKESWAAQLSETLGDSKYCSVRDKNHNRRVVSNKIQIVLNMIQIVLNMIQIVLNMIQIELDMI